MDDKKPDVSFRPMMEIGDFAGGEKGAKGDAKRRLLLMRHGERVDFTFGDWIAPSFAGGAYAPLDLNMPEAVPERAGGAAAFRHDSPLTNVGRLQARLVGAGARRAGIAVARAYCSPALRSIETCDQFLAGGGLKDKVKLRIEPALFEWVGWYEDQKLDFLTVEELLAAGFNVDREYEPMMRVDELVPPEKNAEYYARSAEITRRALGETDGDVLLVGHSATLDTCSRELLGRKPVKLDDILRMIARVPYAAVMELMSTDGKAWEIAEPSFPPVTHSKNDRFVCQFDS